MPESQRERPSFEPISTKERSQKEMVHTLRNVSEISENLHRDVEATYHYLDSGKKREMVEAGATKALAELQIDSVLQAEKFPSQRERFSDIPSPEDGSPQVFAKPVGGGEVLIAIRSNVGNPKTVIMFSNRPDESGKINLNLAEQNGLMHICTEQDLEDATYGTSSITRPAMMFPRPRGYAPAKIAHTIEGAWMRGDITSDDYKQRFEQKHKQNLSIFHKELDTMRKEDKDTQLKAYLARHNLNSIKEDGGIESMWKDEDEDWQIRQENIRRRREIAEGIINDLKADVEKLAELGAKITSKVGVGAAGLIEKLKARYLITDDTERNDA